MNRHLNVFTRYERVDHHEDQLTRAAMIVLRLVPAAREALLRLIDGPGIAQLGTAGEVDMQTSEILARADTRADVDELISVFLVPDETRSEPEAEVVPSPRGQRLDGVLRFLPDLVVVLESKVVEGASDLQARELNYGSWQPRRSRRRNVHWHDLLEAWWRLGDLHLLTPTEELLVQDLLDFADEHFPALLPFTTLRRAAGHEGRVNRRLRALMLLATGFPPRDRTRYLMLDEHLGTESVQRAELAVVTEQRQLWLEMWPGESNSQARHLYSADRANRLAALNGTAGWDIAPNVHLSFRNAHWRQRLYLDASDLPIARYAAQWSDGDLDRIGQYDAPVLREELWPWLLERGYAKPTDDLDWFCERLGNRPAYLRPGIRIRRTWPLDEGEQLDDRNELVGEIRQSINTILTCLDEQILDAPA
jgi:hypothetical protein